MSEDKKLGASELLYHGLVRLPKTLSIRPTMDDRDFLRRRNYKGTGKPENGISAFRKDSFPTLQQFWDRLNPLRIFTMEMALFQKREKVITERQLMLSVTFLLFRAVRSSSVWRYLA